MPFLTREAVTAKIKAGESFAGSLLRSAVQRRSAAPTDVELGLVKERFPDEMVGRVVPFVISSPDRQDDGYALAPKGCDHEQWDRAPIILWHHDRWMPRIADGIVLPPSDDQVTALACFYPREVSEALDGGRSWALGEIAALRGHRASIGFAIVEAAVASEEIRKTIPWALDVSVWRLREWSLVNMGMDDEAISAGRAAGIDTAPIARALERLMDEAVREGLDRAALERAWARASGRPLPSAPPPAVATAADLRELMERASGQLLGR